jgi:hypothetical protein
MQGDSGIYSIDHQYGVTSYSFLSKDGSTSAVHTHGGVADLTNIRHSSGTYRPADSAERRAFAADMASALETLQKHGHPDAAHDEVEPHIQYFVKIARGADLKSPDIKHREGLLSAERRNWEHVDEHNLHESILRFEGDLGQHIDELNRIKAGNRDPELLRHMQLSKNHLLGVVGLIRMHEGKTLPERRILIPKGRANVLDRLETALRNGDIDNLSHILSCETCGLKPSSKQ